MYFRFNNQILTIATSALRQIILPLTFDLYCPYPSKVDFLEEPIMAFARLSKCAILADLTEVAIPTRFIFLVLGPRATNTVWEYEEVGRGMAALLSDKVSKPSCPKQRRFKLHNPHWMAK